jgi:hypothetical protein
MACHAGTWDGRTDGEGAFDVGVEPTALNKVERGSQFLHMV